MARALARELPAHGCDVTRRLGLARAVAATPSASTRAATSHAVRFDRGDAPMHPSYEDRPDAPDRVFAALDDDAYEAHVAAWSRALEEAGAADADVLHLHHLTPIHEAAARVAPDVPVVGHLHGTELLMLERIADGPPAAGRTPRRGSAGCAAGRWRCERLLLLSHSQLERAERVLGIDPARCVIAPNGFDPERFSPRTVDRDAFWRHALVDDPQRLAARPRRGLGRLPPRAGGGRGERARRCSSVSRFTEVKRLGLLVRAFARAREALRESGRSPRWSSSAATRGSGRASTRYDAIRATGARDVYLAGWHEHDELPEFFAASDVVVLSSVREQFGSALVEGMACGLPAVAVDRFGPADIVRPGHTGWLVEPDDEAALAGALAQAIDHPPSAGAAARPRAAT